MEDLLANVLESFAIVAACVVIGLAIGLPFYALRLSQNRKNQPSPEARLRVLRQLSEMKSRDESVAARMLFLRDQGFRKDVAEGLLSDSVRADMTDV